ncbi:hypothetical protein FZC84_21145 [Rossellomorea vietnamensis]|uniref:Homing endonuclease LAGLIDADG domain-containing protein n=1 Tax=Rossellomorea vietnamensis TaxID=218284 RepID=A0A5D4M2E8_9BACI|nr:hypothetical protein [Rossellomorea vietnamensis]TYR95701.1 hypothetical protein FZC84_21145 [Rossellomorea vietnamensis]
MEKDKTSYSLEEMQAAFLAGLCDGEACYSIERRRVRNKKGLIKEYFYPSVRLAMKSQQTIKTARKMTGFGKVYEQKHGMWLLYLYGDEAKVFFKRVKPYMVTKKAEAEMVLEFIENGNRENGREYFEKVRELKRIPQ